MTWVKDKLGLEYSNIMIIVLTDKTQKIFLFLERKVGCFVVRESPAIRSYPLVEQICEFALQGDTTTIGASSLRSEPFQNGCL